jgi:hypothetical protein
MVHFFAELLLLDDYLLALADRAEAAICKRENFALVVDMILAEALLECLLESRIDKELFAFTLGSICIGVDFRTRTEQLKLHVFSELLFQKLLLLLVAGRIPCSHSLLARDIVALVH